ncbi:MAG: chloride channel protein [Betaproteobacteria bacterium]|nr:chloride channel protein [Betaproteobacteria bacterium]
MRRHLKRQARSYLSVNEWQIRLVMWGGAIFLGVAATFFAYISEKANDVFYAALKISPYAAFVLSPLGLMLCLWMTLRFFPGSEGSGIPQAIAAYEEGAPSALRDKLFSLRIAFGKILVAVLSLCVGASIGREGPTVHVGAAFMHSFGKLMRYRPEYMERALILAGGAAGIAAAFNTPLAGVVFAIEEVSRSFEEKTSGVVLAAVLVGGMTSLVLLGNYTYFGVSDAAFTSWHDWLIVPVAGIVGGGLGGLFSQMLVVAARLVGPIRRRYPMRVALACGLALALVGLLSGNTIFGTGYAQAKSLVTLTGTMPATYAPLKALATLISYLAGIPGGLFAPSLSAGAGFGSLLGHFFPHVPLGALVILGMAGYFTGVVQTPITSFVIIMEMTSNQGILLPLIAVAFIARGASHLVCPEPIYQALAASFRHKPDTAPQTAPA